MNQPGTTPNPPNPDDPSLTQGRSDEPHQEPPPAPEAQGDGAPADAPPATEGSPEFARALEEFDRGQPQGQGKGSKLPGEVKVGSRVKATVRSINDDVALVDFGGRSEGSVETKHFRAEDGTLKIGVGDVVELFVVEAGDQVALAPSLKPGSPRGG